ncbi:ABC transporter ATP-binding protein [Tengunoibacter tsumagoiensis]|uniref:ABC transporter n=1 Tax=Tengunoibacter tsumagoiensis TaxID=2014871 RepID=A0A402A847_9CHLR|nr:ABC transporter ATP-binding protein [Tengunoibacter tsumagoiensis]GCE15175.1 ABC transporter [Tengunoibacter tsumagoiensis]
MERGILARGLTKVYKTRKHRGWLRVERQEKVAVQDLTFHIPPGQVTGLLGLNGAGKTTTIKMLSTLLAPTSGELLLDGIDMQRQLLEVRKRVNMIAGGERMVYWRLTGRENLWYFGQLYNIDGNLLKRRIEELLHLVGLADAADTVVERYSKGMKQRLQIARGLINDPSYLFLDEPTIGLDAPIARELRQVVRAMAESGKGLLLTSHYLHEVEELCSSIYVINQGRLIAEGSPADLKRLTSQERIIRMQLPSLPADVEAGLREMAREHMARLEILASDEVITVTLRHPQDLGGSAATTVVRTGGTLLKLEVVEPSLEDAILALSDSLQRQEQEEEVGHGTR